MLHAVNEEHLQKHINLWTKRKCFNYSIVDWKMLIAELHCRSFLSVIISIMTKCFLQQTILTFMKQTPSRTTTMISWQLSYNKETNPKAFLSSSSSSLHGDDNTTSSTATGCGNGSCNNDIDDSNNSCESKSPENKTTHLSESLSKFQNKNIASNYNTVGNIIAKQLATNVSESVKRVGSTGGGHFRDLKEKIAATSRKGVSLEECKEKSQQKLVKNFNEFLNFASINKSRVGNSEKMNASILSAEGQSLAAKKSKSPSPTHNQNSPAPTLHPLVQLTKEGFGSSLDDSDSSSLPDTTNNTWSCSTAATAIQQANNFSSNSLQLELNSQLSSLTHTPVRTPVAERQKGQSSPSATYKHQERGDSSATPDDSQELDYYPISTAITRELRLEAENLDRQLFGNFDSTQDGGNCLKCSSTSEIEYEKLGKDSLDMVEDLKENEIITCREVSELMLRRQERDKTFTHTPENKTIDALNGKSESNFILSENKRGQIEQTNKSLFRRFSIKRRINANYGIITTTSQPSKFNSKCSNSNLYNLPPQSVTLPEVLVPISSTNTPDRSAIDEMATTAAEEEVTFSTKSAQFSNSSANNFTTTPRLPPPSEFGGGNPFLMFLCLTLLLQHRNTIMKSNMDYNEIAMHFDKMVRKHDVTKVLNQARRMYIDYLKNQSTFSPQSKHEQQQTPRLSKADNAPRQQQLLNDVYKNGNVKKNDNANTNHYQKHSKNDHNSTSVPNTSPSYYDKPS
ncbi:hypothetical protein DOY81_010486 [Sarcophaga bullata]|nr:hypothetical protein DOY81_010486 [Sarcophaga bullata]